MRSSVKKSTGTDHLEETEQEEHTYETAARLLLATTEYYHTQSFMLMQ
jgi:hypothetical protein